MTKRKRASEVVIERDEHLTGGVNAIAGPSTPTPSSAIKNGVRPRHSVTFSTPGIATPSPSKRVGPQIMFLLADGSKSWQRPLDGERTLIKWTKKALKRFGIEADPEQVRLSHVRDGGREVDIWDEYDFSAFRMRSFANPSSESIIKIYHPSSSLSASLQVNPIIQNSISTPELQPVTPTPVSKRDKNKGKASPAPPATPLSVLEGGSTPTAKKGGKTGKGKGKGKLVEVVDDIETPAPPGVQLTEKHAANPASNLEQAESSVSTTPTGAVPSETPSNKNAAKKKRKRDSVVSEVVDPATTASTDSPTTNAAEQRNLSPQKKKQRKKKRESAVPETPSVELLASSPPTTNVDAPGPRPPLIQNKSLLDRYKPIKPSPLGREEVDAASENGSDNMEVETPEKSVKKNEKAKAKKQEKKKSKMIHTDDTMENVAGTIHSGVEQVGQEIAVESILTAPNKVVEESVATEVEPTEITLPIEIFAPSPITTNRTKQIVISTPRILYAKPNSPPIHITSRYSSSSISRSPPSLPEVKKVAAKIARRAKEPSLDLESEEGADSPSPRWEAIESHVYSDEIDQLVSSPVLEPLSIVEDEEEEDSGKKAKEQRKKGKNSLPVVNGASSEDDLDVQSPSTVKKKAPTSAKKAAKVRTGATSEDSVDAVTVDGHKSSSPPPIPSLSSTPIHLSSSGTDASPATDPPARDNDAHSPTATTTNPPAPIKGKSVRAQLARLAQRGVCVICYGPSHLQLDCPRVKAGIDSLKELLAERKVEEETGTTEQSIEVIEMWIDRLGRIANAVKGNSNPASPANKQNASTVSSASKPSEQPNGSSPSQTSPATAPVGSSPQRETTNVTAAQVDTPSVPTSEEAAPKSSQKAPPSPPREHNLPPIHLKALATRKAGSISGLSVSDAVIETESSASESDEEDVAMGSPVNGNAQLKRRDSFESDNSAGSGSDSDRPVEDDDQVEDERSDGASPSKSPSNRSGFRSRSASASSSSAASVASTITATSSSSAPNIPVPMHDSQAALDHFLTMPLSQRQKRAARQSAAAMQTIDVDEVEAEDASEVESDDEPAPRLAAHGRRGSESSVGEFGEDDVDQVSLAEDEDEVMPFSQAPPVLSSSQHEPEPEFVKDTEVIESASLNGESGQSDQSRRSRSFADLAALSSPSPMVAEFPGDIAVQDTIREDEMLSFDDVQPASPAHLRTGSGSGHVVSQGLISPPSSNGELGATAHDPLPATQLLPEPESQEIDANTTPKASQDRRRGRSAKAIETEQEKEKDVPAPISQRPTSPVRRRLRSASRELPDSPRVTTRRVSAQSQASDVSNSQSLSQGVRRSTRRTTPVRSSQVDQLDSSQLRPVVNTTIPEDVEGEVEKEQEGQPETPLVPETQLSQTPTPLPNGHIEEITPTQRSPRTRNRTAPSPLFMSQGSQIQPTQAYNLFPTRGSSSILSLHSDPVDETNANGNALGVGLDSSPLITPRVGAGKKRNGVRISSPILEDVEDHTISSPEKNTPPSTLAAIVNGNGNDSESEHEAIIANGDKVDPEVTGVNGDASDGDNQSQSGSGSGSDSNSGSDSEIEADVAKPIITIPKFQAPRPHVTIPSSFPTLSSLPREALRKKTPSTSAFSQAVRPTPDKPQIQNARRKGGMSMSMSQPTPRKGKGIRTKNQQDQDQDSSDSSSSSSSEDESSKSAQLQLKGRYAGRKTRSTSAAASTVRGW